MDTGNRCILSGVSSRGVKGCIEWLVVPLLLSRESLSTLHGFALVPRRGIEDHLEERFSKRQCYMWAVRCIGKKKTHQPSHLLYATHEAQWVLPESSNIDELGRVGMEDDGNNLSPVEG